jgi:hypothetical protein
MHSTTSTQRRIVRLALAACAATTLVAGAPAAAHAAPEPTVAPTNPVDGVLGSSLTDSLGLDLGTLANEELTKILGSLGPELSGVELGNGLNLPVAG